MITSSINKRQFIIGLTTLCCFYVAIEFIFHHFTMITVDEFWFAHRIYQYKNGIPYRDFAPYKTILGYYILLPTMLFGKGIYPTLTLMKNTIAILNAALLFLSATWLTNYFSRFAVLTSLFFLVFTDTVLAYSTNIRVDLFGYWFGFFAFLTLLEKRYILAGLLLGIGFLCTQKIIWYWAAINFSVGLYWLAHSRDAKTFRQMTLLNLVTATVILAYLAFWSVVTDWVTIRNSVFGEAAAMYHLSWYNFTRKLFWSIIIKANPLVFLCAPLPLLSLLASKRDNIRFIVTVFSLTILALLIPYKQVFPYYMQVTIPVFFLLYASFIHWLRDVYSGKISTIISAKCIWLFVAIHIAAILATIIFFNLPVIYTLAVLIPMFIAYQLTTKKETELNIKLLLTTAIFIGVIYPATLFFIKGISTTNQYQQENIANLQMLLKDGSDYVAGIELLYNRDQPISGMRHLICLAVDYLYKPTAAIRTIMFPSQYEDPRATPETIIRALQSSNVKVYVNTYRMLHLPPNILTYLKNHYAHFWGSIYLYAPRVRHNQLTFRLRFSGDYLIEADENEPIYIDGRRRHGDSIIHLQKGQHVSTTQTDYRLKLYPKMKGLWLNPAFKKDDWQRFLF